MHGYKWPINSPRTRKCFSRAAEPQLEQQRQPEKLAKQYVDHTCTLLEVEQTQANTPGQKTGARLPTTYYVYDLMWNGKRYALRKRFSDFKSLDKALRPLLGACAINRPCAQQYVGKYQSCMVISGRLIAHAPV